MKGLGKEAALWKVDTKAMMVDSQGQLAPRWFLSICSFLVDFLLWIIVAMYF